VWVIDRGGDREKLLENLIVSRRRFLLRLRGDQHLIWQGKVLSGHEIALDCPMLYLEYVVKEESSQEWILRLQFGFRSVRFPGFDEAL